MEIKITKTIIDNVGRKFDIGDDVSFLLNRNGKVYDCIGIIKDIKEDTFEIRKVQIDKMTLSETLIVKYSEVKNGVFKYVDNGYY